MTTAIEIKKTPDVTNNSFSTIQPEYNESDIVCHCLSIRRCEITPLIAKNNAIFDLDKFISKSGAGSVCTGCHLLLREISGDSIWTSVNISKITTISENVKTYRFESNGLPFESALAGQHIVVQAYIEGQWELRRYTLTSPSGITNYREITIKIKPGGRFSNWMHRISESQEQIRISQPTGTVTPDLISSKPLICLVGGIGITPAIAFARSIKNKERGNRKLIIDYSDLNNNSLVYKEELNTLSNENSNISIHFRLTNISGFVTQLDIDKLVATYPNSEFYICGPTEFLNSINSYLRSAEVADERISAELFTTPDKSEITFSRSYFYIGIMLFILFIAQDLLQLKVPFIENLQSQQDYKVYSGLLLVTYILSQFVMPYNKSCSKPHASAKTYRRHKLRGILAPLIFYIHSTQFGTAYLFLLSCTYFSNFILGLFNHEILKDAVKRVTYFKVWLPTHIAVSVILLSLIALHIYIISAY